MFQGQSVLIVEDDPLIALDLADSVAHLRGNVIGPVATVSKAMQILDRQFVAAAILDVQLLDADITPVALRLASSHIPLVIHTAAGMPPEVAALWPDLPVLMKPAPAQTVVLRLWSEMTKSARLLDKSTAHRTPESRSEPQFLPSRSASQWRS